jgi:hypothetical protein
MYDDRIQTVARTTELSRRQREPFSRFLTIPRNAKNYTVLGGPLALPDQAWALSHRLVPDPLRTLGHGYNFTSG